MSDERIRVEVAYARPDKQKILELYVTPGTTVLEAARLSGIDEHFPEVDFDSMPMGVFGKVEKVPGKRELREGERVEIYRPLRIDPKQVRRRRAEKSSGSGAGRTGQTVTGRR